MLPKKELPKTVAVAAMLKRMKKTETGLVVEVATRCSFLIFRRLNNNRT
jgi:hypothetical protein